MKVDTYLTLLADLGHEVGVDAQHLLEHGRLVVDGTEIALARDTVAEDEHLWICVDFGEIPSDEADRVYRAMLEANLRAGSLEVGMFMLQEQERAALLVRRRLTSEITGEQLAHALLQYAAAARGWIATAAGVPVLATTS